MQPGVNYFPAIHAQGLPAVQEAAVMYASGRGDDAERVLRQALDAGSFDLRPWQLLLALYRLQGEWERFEALAARFAERFGGDAPAWLGEDALARLPRELREDGEAYVSLAGPLDRRAAAALTALRDRVKAHATVHVDASKLTGVDAEGCAALEGTLAALARQGSGVLLSGGEHLTQLLHAATHGGDNARAYWTLLLALLRLRGQPATFQRVALEYALATGEPAPEWEPALMPVVVQRAPQERRDAPRYETEPDALALTGTLAGAGDAQLDAVQAFADERQYVNLDLAGVLRMDPAGASALIEAVNAMTSAGKVVRLIRPNPLVEALLETLQLDARVQLVRAAAP
jgi:ABC-type transporter Mla MlaB component